MKPYSDLANAIIIRAAEDYKIFLDRLKYLLREPSFNGRRIAETEREIQKIEEFFGPEWYNLMTDISGEELMRRVRKEVDQ